MRKSRSLAAVLLSLGLACPALAQEKPVVDPGKQTKIDLSGSLIAGPTNMYLASIGYPLLNNNSTQIIGTLNLAKDVLFKGDSFSGLVWFNYGHGRHMPTLHELDLQATYTSPAIAVPGGTASATLGYAIWKYGGNQMPEIPDDKMLISTLTYSGMAVATLRITQRLNDGIELDRQFQLFLSKTIPASKRISFTPNIIFAGAQGFFGQKGFLGTTTGMTASYALGSKNGVSVGLDGYVNRFWHSGSHILEMPVVGALQLRDVTQYGANLTCSWSGRK